MSVGPIGLDRPAIMARGGERAPRRHQLSYPRSTPAAAPHAPLLMHSGGWHRGWRSPVKSPDGAAQLSASSLLPAQFGAQVARCVRRGLGLGRLDRLPLGATALARLIPAGSKARRIRKPGRLAARPGGGRGAKPALHPSGGRQGQGRQAHVPRVTDIVVTKIRPNITCSMGVTPP